MGMALIPAVRLLETTTKLRLTRVPNGLGIERHGWGWQCPLHLPNNACYDACEGVCFEYCQMPHVSACLHKEGHPVCVFFS